MTNYGEKIKTVDLNNGQITELQLENFRRCNYIWNMDDRPWMADKFYEEIREGNHRTYVYEIEEIYYGEASLVFDMNDPDYTIPCQRIYLSRFLVREDC